MSVTAVIETIVVKIKLVDIDFVKICSEFPCLLIVTVTEFYRVYVLTWNILFLICRYVQGVVKNRFRFHGIAVLGVQGRTQKMNSGRRRGEGGVENKNSSHNHSIIFGGGGGRLD